MRQDVVDEARQWLGVPWRHLGRNRAGVDCVGLGVVVCHRLNIPVIDVAAYSRTPNPALLKHLQKVADEIPVSEAEVGDFFAIRDQQYPFHVAFLSEKNGIPHIIHAHARRRMVVEEPFANEWPALVTHAFRFRA